MNELDLTIPAKVNEVIKRFGRFVTWQVRTKTYNKATDETVIGAPVQTQVKVTPPSSCTVEYTETNGGTLAQRVGLKFMTTPSLLGTVIPNVHEDTVLISGIKFLVVRIDPIFTGDLIAAYRVYLVGTNGIPSE